MYAYYKQLDYFSTECVYSPFAYRGFARDFLKDLEKLRARSIIDIIRSAEHFAVAVTHKEAPILGKCSECGYMSSQRVCKACALLHRLNRGRPRVAIQLDNDSTIPSATTKQPASSAIRSTASAVGSSSNAATTSSTAAIQHAPSSLSLSKQATPSSTALTSPVLAAPSTSCETISAMKSCETSTATHACACKTKTNCS